MAFDRGLINECSGHVVDAGMRVHSRLGPGLLESVYENCLAYELRKKGFDVLQQLEVPLQYDEVTLDVGFRMDLLVSDLVVVEVKAVARLNQVHEAALLTYLRLSDHRVGLLMNFNELHLRDGLKRLVNAF